MRRLISAILLCLFCGTAFADPQGISGAITDLFYVDPLRIGISTGNPQPPNLASLGLSQTAAQTIDITKTNLILILAGQSNISDVAPNAFSPVNASSLFQLNSFDGKIYPASDPLLGTTLVFGPGAQVGNPGLRIADTLVTNGNFQRVLLVPIAVSGTAVDWWNTKEEKPLLPLVLRRIAQKGIVCGGTNTTCVILWGQGEEDTVLGTSQASYANSLATLISNTATAGFIGKWFIAHQTYYNGQSSAAVAAAQASIPNGTTVFAGPNSDALVGNVCGASANAACRQENIHWTDNGSYSYAAAWITALHASGAPF